MFSLHALLNPSTQLCIAALDSTWEVPNQLRTHFPAPPSRPLKSIPGSQFAQSFNKRTSPSELFLPLLLTRSFRQGRAAEIENREKKRNAAEIENEVERTNVEEAERGGGEGQAAAFKCLTKIATPYNQIVVLESPASASSQYAGSRVLLLDNSGNVHSVYRRDTAWTNSYWDEFASLPAVIPEGPVAMFGLGGGTAARLLLELWPHLRLEGYEIDEILVDQARLLLGLSDLEVPTSKGGCLTVHIESVFSPSATVDGGFAGIIVDVFSEGGVPAELQRTQTWLDLQKRLKPGGRIMANCGGVCVEKCESKANVEAGTWTWEDGGATKDATILAMASAFDGQISLRTIDSEADNCIALSGPLPDLESWAAAVPEKLREGIPSWKPFI